MKEIAKRMYSVPLGSYKCMFKQYIPANALGNIL